MKFWVLSGENRQVNGEIKVWKLVEEALRRLMWEETWVEEDVT